MYHYFIDEFSFIMRVFIAIFSVVLLVFSCSVKSKLSEPEDFSTFQKRFYFDSVFQYDRINFPLEMQQTQGSLPALNDTILDSNIDTVIFTRNTLPQMIKGIDQYPDTYESKTEVTQHGIDEIILIPSSGYMERRSFTLVKNRWYLFHLYIIDL